MMIDDDDGFGFIHFPSFSFELRLDFIKALPDIEDRINKWQELTVNKSVKAAESGFIKALKKKGGVLTSPEALEQLNNITTDASAKALAYFDGLSVPFCRLGSVAEANTARAKLMAAALSKAQGNDPTSSSANIKIGFNAALAAKEREGHVRPKRKGGVKRDKTSSRQCLMTLGKHLLK